jgi:hypothetical protein
MTSEEGHVELVADLISRYQVAKWVLFHLSQSPEGEILPWVVDAPAGDLGPVQSIQNAHVQDYTTTLMEAYRPQTKGSYAGALHLHSFNVDKQRYYFVSRGAKKWIFKDDRIRFSFVKMPTGDRKILKKSLQTLDAKGNHVKRGNRTAKAR